MTAKGCETPATGESGMRTPTVRPFAWASRFGTSLVAFRMKVYGPGVAALMLRKAALSSCTNWPSCAKSAHTSVKWWRSSSWRMRRMRSAPVVLSSWKPSA